ncbi:MAG: M48 family metalloprotease [Gemmatimonadales bacterium]|nr:M48 family metalloprotease [Gemmatimonadales bacterium]
MRPTSLIAVALLLAGCAVNPVTGKRQLSLVSEAQEIEMGKGEVVRAREETGFYPDTALTAYIAGIGMRMARASERPDLPWEFHLIDDPMVNAFAAPGGFIFITRGILAYMNSEAELAGVIGHEIGHVTAKHTVAAISRQQVGTIGVIGAAILTKNEQVAQLGSAGLGVLFLKYGRDQESQSDALGHKYSLTQGYDVREMPKTFATLQRVSDASGNSGRIPGFLSTHPDPGDRVAATTRWADTVSNPSKLTIGRDRFLDRLDRMVYGQDPRQGYFEGQRYLHPELRFQFDMPAGWQGINQTQQIVLVEPNGVGQIQLSQVPQTTTAAAMQAWQAQQGVVTGVVGNANNIAGGQGVTAEFSATVENGQQLRGRVLYFSYRGAIWQFLGIATAAAWPQVQNAVNGTFLSFAATPTNQQFRRVRELRVIALPRAMTMTALAGESGGAATAAELALINSAEEGVMLPQGRKVKTIRFR